MDNSSEDQPATPKNKKVLWFGLTPVLAIALAFAYFNNQQSEPETIATLTPQTFDQELFEQIDNVTTGNFAAFVPTDKVKDRRDLFFHMPDGEKTTLAEWNGKVTLINLWATWCAPCRHEMPAFDNLQKEMGSDAFEVITINVDNGERGLEKAKDFFKEVGLEHLALYHENNKEAFDYFAQKVVTFGLPSTILVSHDGKELGKLNGAAVWDSDQAKQLVQVALDARAKDLGL